MTKNVVNKRQTIKKLFLLDGCGAILSAFLLGIVLVEFESVFGIAKSVLYSLAMLPCFFAVYDFYCFFKITNNLGRFLKGIAVANLLYCCLSIGLVSLHYQETTCWGWTYIIIEVIVVVGIAFIELRVVKWFSGK